jgi:hypothetical protein
MMSFHWMLIAKRKSQFLERLNAANCTENFLSGKKINQYAPHGTQENFEIFFFHLMSWFWSSSSLEKQCDTIPCSIILFWGQNGGTSFHHQS